jgi:epoxide hydrolase-like predicted phosphatase
MSGRERDTVDPKAVKAAVFDLGGVLIEGGPREVLAFGERVGLTPEQWEPVRRALFGNESAWASLERGEIPFEAFVEELKRRVIDAGGRVDDVTARAFMGRPEPMSETTTIRTAMVEAVRALKAVMPTALLTNNIVEWRQGWSALFDDPSLFDVVVDSSAVGARKPERRIYEVTQQRLGVAHEEIFFVDDIGQNLKAARALGWHTLLFTEESVVLPVLEKLRAARDDA